jgi:ribosomal-protein-alanine N-acetyltransferase
MEIYTPRLRLREFVPDDWPAVLAYQRDPRYLRFYTWEDRTPEAARAMLDFGFRTLGLHRIMAYCAAENTASAHVLEKLGMAREGCLRESWRIKGRWHDSLMYAILEHEWRAALGPPIARSA